MPETTAMIRKMLAILLCVGLLFSAGAFAEEIPAEEPAEVYVPVDPADYGSLFTEKLAGFLSGYDISREALILSVEQDGTGLLDAVLQQTGGLYDLRIQLPNDETAELQVAPNGLYVAYGGQCWFVDVPEIMQAAEGLIGTVTPSGQSAMDMLQGSTQALQTVFGGLVSNVILPALEITPVDGSTMMVRIHLTGDTIKQGLVAFGDSLTADTDTLNAVLGMVQAAAPVLGVPAESFTAEAVTAMWGMYRDMIPNLPINLNVDGDFTISAGSEPSLIGSLSVNTGTSRSLVFSVNAGASGTRQNARIDVIQMTAVKDGKPLERGLFSLEGRCDTAAGNLHVRAELPARGEAYTLDGNIGSYHGASTANLQFAAFEHDALMKLLDISLTSSEGMLDVSVAGTADDETLAGTLHAEQSGFRFTVQKGETIVIGKLESVFTGRATTIDGLLEIPGEDLRIELTGREDMSRSFMSSGSNYQLRVYKDGSLGGFVNVSSVKTAQTSRWNAAATIDGETLAATWTEDPSSAAFTLQAMEMVLSALVQLDENGQPVQGRVALNNAASRSSDNVELRMDENTFTIVQNGDKITLVPYFASEDSFVIDVEYIPRMGTASSARHATFRVDLLESEDGWEILLTGVGKETGGSFRVSLATGAPDGAEPLADSEEIIVIDSAYIMQTIEELIRQAMQGQSGMAVPVSEPVEIPSVG